MKQEIARLMMVGTFALSVLLCAAWKVQAQDNKHPYPKMAPVEEYLMADRNAEIALARSAAPEAISRDAKILVLTRHGYETAVEGKNGFVCSVDRGWMAGFDNRVFWNPKLRGPLCFNPPAARSVLPIHLKRTEWILSGLSKEQVIEKSKAALANKEFPALEPGAMSYMMSRQSFLDDHAGHWVPHLMFYVPQTEAITWGSDMPDSPVYLNDQFSGAPEPISVFMVPVGKWSDGNLGPS
jgi:hypothetical protein